MSASPDLGDTVVRRMTVDDAPWVAALHLDTLKTGMFPRLGASFMDVYYRSFVDSPHAVALVSEAGGALAGALVGTVRNAAHYRWVVRHHGRVLALAGVRGLAFHPTVAAQFVRNRAGRYLRGVLRHALPRRRTSTAGDGGSRQTVAVLSHIAVDPAYRGHGLGADLVTRYLSVARQQGARNALLVTRAGEHGASAFWEHLGWQPSGTHRDADGQLVRRFRLPLAP